MRTLFSKLSHQQLKYFFTQHSKDLTNSYKLVVTVQISDRITKNIFREVIKWTSCMSL